MAVLRWWVAGDAFDVIELIETPERGAVIDDVSKHDGREGDLPCTIRAFDLWRRHVREVRTLRRIQREMYVQQSLLRGHCICTTFSVWSRSIAGIPATVFTLA